MKKQNPETCMHLLIGYPPNSKRRYKFVPSGDTWTCYSCYAGRTLDVDITVLNADDIRKGLGNCKYCGKKLEPKKERITLVECAWCKDLILL